MGKGTINSHIGDGQYSLTVNYNRDLYDKTVAALDAKIAGLAAKLIEIGYGNDGYDLAKLEKKALEKRKNELGNFVPDDKTITAWCADLTDDLSGVVATVEVPGESAHVQIMPGYDGRADYVASDHGQLTPTMAQTAAGAFYNLAMLPGWQKWKPTFRYGIISNIDTDAHTCDVGLEDAISSQGLGVNQNKDLSNVPIEYMECNSSAFDDGDEVLVKFEGQDWNNPKVIGFKENPKPCLLGIIVFKLGLKSFIWDAVNNTVLVPVGDQAAMAAAGYYIDAGFTTVNGQAGLSKNSLYSKQYIPDFKVSSTITQPDISSLNCRSYGIYCAGYSCTENQEPITSSSTFTDTAPIRYPDGSDVLSTYYYLKYYSGSKGPTYNVDSDNRPIDIGPFCITCKSERVTEKEYEYIGSYVSYLRCYELTANFGTSMSSIVPVHCHTYAEKYSNQKTSSWGGGRCPLSNWETYGETYEQTYKIHTPLGQMQDIETLVYDYERLKQISNPPEFGDPPIPVSYTGQDTLSMFASSVIGDGWYTDKALNMFCQFYIFQYVLESMPMTETGYYAPGATHSRHFSILAQAKFVEPPERLVESNPFEESENTMLGAELETLLVEYYAYYVGIYGDDRVNTNLNIEVLFV